MAQEDCEEAGREMRGQWESFRAEADRAKADRAKADNVKEGFRSERTKHVGQMGDCYEQELLSCARLARGQMVAAKMIGQECKEKYVRGTGITWKEAAESVHRCLNLSREPMNCQDALRHRFIQQMREFLVLASRSQAVLCEFDNAITTANLFMEVRSEEIREEEIQVLMTRGIASFYQGLPASVADFSAAVTLAKKLKHTELEAHAWFSKGYALYFVDPIDYKDDIYICFENCLKILQAANDTPRIDSVCKVFKAIGERYETSWAPRHKSKTERLDREAEIEKLKQAEEKQSKERDGYPGELASTKQALGYWLFHQEMYLEAEEKFRQSIKLWTKANQTKKDSMYLQVTAGQSITTVYNQLQLCLVKQKKPLEALMWAERARARTLRFRLDQPAGECDLFEENDIRAQEKIMTALNGCTVPVVVIEYSFVSTDLLIWVLKPKSSPTVYQVPLDTMDFPQIAGKVVEKTSFTIMKLVDILLQRISGDNSDRKSKEYLEFFHMLLMEPIKDELRDCDSASTAIVVIPVQALNRLPWAALLDPHGQYLGQRYVVLCAPSLYMLGVCSQNWAKKRTTKCSHDDDILLVSNPWPLSLPYLSSLKWAEKETGDIRKLLKTYTGLAPTEYKRGGASRATVIEKLRKAKWVHIACHNTFDNYYSAGALILSAPNAMGYGWCKPPDVLDIPLDSGRMLHTRRNYGSIVGHPMDSVASQEETDRGLVSARQLTNIMSQACGVVLSACSTGEGELISEEGILGFARALLVAGTPTVMLSLWDISDEHTSTLMTHVYKKLLEGDPETGLPYTLAFALKRAMESMIGDPKVQVRHWAAFQIIGTPDVIFPVSQTNNCKPELGWSKKSYIFIASLVLAGIAIILAMIFRY